MKELFNRLTLSTKLTLLGLIPLVFLVFVIIEYQREKDEKIMMITGYINRIDQAMNINNLLLSLQMERRFSFAYAFKQQQQNELVQQRTRTDELIGIAEKDSDLSSSGSASLSSFTFLNQLPEFRKRVDSKSAQALEIMNFYTNAIFRLSSLNSVASGNVVYLQPINKSLRGQKLLSDIITYRGISLAQIYFLLETGETNPQMIASIIQLKDITDTYVTEFNLRAPEDVIKQFENFQKDTVFRAVTAVENTIKATNRLDTSISPEFWWTASTTAVNRLRQLQIGMMERSREGAADILANERQQQRWSVIAIIAVFVVAFVFIVYTIKTITAALNQLSTAARALAVGKTNLEITATSKDAIGSLADSLTEIDKNNQALALAAKSIGEGDFSIQVQPRSSEDEIGNAIATMKQDLQTFTEENQQTIWIQTGLANLNASVSGEKDMLTLSKSILDALATYLDAQVGILYSARSGELLEYVSGYAIANGQHIPKTLSYGETLIGQTAEKKEIVYLDNVPADFVRISTATGDANPRNIVIIPLVHNNEVEGVIELASLQPFSPSSKKLLQSASSGIAIALQTAKNRARVQELLEETQAQAEELQTQHSELENLNTELEAQTQRLQASEEELRVQQEELQQANSELEERTRLLEEKNQEIAERNLDISRKAAELEQSTKYKSEFLANMSHELRTPLNSILLLSRLMSENPAQNLNEEQVEYAKVIQSSGQGLLALIDEILDLSKIEAGKMTLEFERIQVTSIMNDMRSMFEPLAKEKGIEFNTDIVGAVPETIETDKLRLEQIIKNLLSNAIKFTTQGSVSLIIEKQKNNAISFAVKDTGIGIPKEKQSLIFEAFQQADGSTRRKYGGTGLGLSISRELVKLLGGSFELQSDPGKGSCFTVYIPVSPQAKPLVTIREEFHEIAEELSNSETREEINQQLTDKYKATVIPSNIPDDRNSISSNDKTLLIIDDDTAFAKALLDFTHKKGYKGIVAVRGDEGIELARQFKPVGILLDLQLPIKSGWEVMEELKKDPATKHIPVHMMSSYEVKNESLIKGAIDFVNKPVAFEQMQQVFKKLEHVISKESKKVLIVEENPKHAKALAYFLESFNVNSEVRSDITSGVSALKGDIDCVILDMGIPDHKTYEMLEQVKQEQGLEHLPIIIFTGKSLSLAEEQRIRKYADTIVVKTAHSYQRILDEVSLFLHLVEENKKPKDKNSYKKLGVLNEVVKGKTVLVVDDDVRNVFSLTRALEKLEVKVITALNGKEALDKLDEYDGVDIVLLDMMMPEMDGYETATKIRQNYKWKDLPVIAVTAKAMTGDRERCIRAGASDYITKPVDIDQLISLLRVWLYEKV